jgi:putative peptidoglycan lipid II flippase
MTLISRILGFVRDIITAKIFGATASVDAFLIAFKIPNFMRSLFAEGSFSNAFVPTLAMYKQTKTSAQVQLFIANMSGVLGLILLIVTLIGVFGSQGLITVFAPGLDPYRFELANTLLKWTFPYLMLISLTAFVGAILNNYGQFWVPAFTPALLNICLIVSALWLTRYFAVPVTSLAVGVLIAGFLQFGFQLPFLKRMGFLQWPRFDWRNSGVRSVLRRMLPALFGASVVQIGLLLNTVLASFLVAGSVTWLYYSDRLAYFPLGVFGVALSTVILPHLSHQHAMQNAEGFSSTLNWGLRCNLLIGLPASLCLVLLAQPIIITLLHYGKFSVHDVFMTQKSVMAYALGLQAFMFIKVLAAAFYAQHNIQTPVRIGVLALGANLLFSLLLISTLKHAGLALASSLSAWINVILLLKGLQTRRIFQWQAGWWVFISRLFFANGVLGLFLFWATAATPTWLAWSGSERFLHLFLLGSGALVLYLTCLWVSGLRWADLRAIP